tara:strand:- start:2285 stop:2584 length:300 start_codon:yes stop_codon:yes gene_type:complete
MKKVLAAAVVILAMFIPMEVLAGPQEKMHMTCKDQIRLTLEGRAVLRGINNNMDTMIGKYRVRNSNGAKYVNCVYDKLTGGVTLIDRDTKLQVALVAQL